MIKEANVHVLYGSIGGLVILNCGWMNQDLVVAKVESVKVSITCGRSSGSCSNTVKVMNIIVIVDAIKKVVFCSGQLWLIENNRQKSIWTEKSSWRASEDAIM